MARPQQLVARGLAVASIVAVLAVAPSAFLGARAQAASPSIQSTGVVDDAPTAAPTTKILTFGTSVVYSPNYLSTCVHTANPAFYISNKTTVNQTVTNLPGQTGAIIVPAGKTIGVTVSGSFPGFILQGLASNPSTALVVYCS